MNSWLDVIVSYSHGLRLNASGSLLSFKTIHLRSLLMIKFSCLRICMFKMTSLLYLISFGKFKVI